MELRHLRYFVAVAELGSISRAADKLYMAQPPLSAQIRQLEDEVGATLLLRVPRGVRLTPAGQSFLEDARAILARAQQATVRARESQAGLRATWRLGLMPSTTHTLLPGLLRRIDAAGLDIQVAAREMIPSSRQLRALRNDELDLGFLRPGGDLEGLETVAAISDPYCLALPQGHPLAQGQGPLNLKQALHEVFVSFSRYSESDFFDQTAALCAEAGFMPNIRHEAGQFVNVLALVACGLGVAIVPASCATLPIRQGVVFRRMTGSRYNSRLVLVAAERRTLDDWSAQAIALAVDELRAIESSLLAIGNG
ncbi:DNA-binding transcriptional LysR family regulator [Comamonas sp. BIGb0124]|uniref:LysR family transcriptional regulator n=1 Tax=Comamonas sp. BIGb0124 TaxID=2485130 RepID=UPI000F460F8D|nr:LysR substrate-binding domain-containing protein [Comamonas sp. BIGb0124]ROR24445.1 DNA-binding transcriptional LysR family regulator [Comamonas sp. BIGb0124]